MAGKTDYSKIHKRYQEQKRRQAEMDDERWWKPDAPQPGGPSVTHKIRILPPPDGHDLWYVEYGMHYRLKGDGDQSVSVTCPYRTLQKPCPVCEFVKGLWKAGTESDIALAREIGAKTRFCSNVLVLSKNPSEVKVWAYGKKFIWDPLNELCAADENGNFLPFDDPVKGLNFKLVVSVERTSEGNFPNYLIQQVGAPTPIQDKSVLEKLHPIHELIRARVKSYDELRSILLGGETQASSGDIAPQTKAEEEPAAPAPAEDSDNVVVNEEKTNAQTVESGAKAQPAVQSAARPSTDELIRKARAAMEGRKAK